MQTHLFHQVRPIEHVILIDDDSFYIYALEKLMGIFKFASSIASFSSSVAALEHLKTAKAHPALVPDVILVDANMPEMDGWAFLEHFSAYKGCIKKNIMIYLMSASNSEEDLQRAASDKRIAGYLIKPIAKEVLLRVQSEVQSQLGNAAFNRAS